jgi:glucan phosphoethanolaminetransferase (alkaline phosphatase superfamily)
MSLKLFRSTGYSSILVPGETRLAMHPGWVVVATSAWVGFACNVPLWRALAGHGGGLSGALLGAVFATGGSAALLSFFGWRRTLKLVATAALFGAAVVACLMWASGPAIDGAHALPSLAAVSWASLMHWQAGALMLALGLLPMLWVWQAQLRRLPGPRQLAANSAGIAFGLALMAGAGLLLFGLG